MVCPTPSFDSQNLFMQDSLRNMPTPRVPRVTEVNYRFASIWISLLPEKFGNNLSHYKTRNLLNIHSKLHFDKFRMRHRLFRPKEPRHSPSFATVSNQLVCSVSIRMYRSIIKLSKSKNHTLFELGRLLPARLVEHKDEVIRSNILLTECVEEVEIYYRRMIATINPRKETRSKKGSLKKSTHLP